MTKIATMELLKKLEESDECKEIRTSILHERVDFNEDEYLLASQILNATSEKYFHLGFKTCLSIITDIANELKMNDKMI